MKPIIPNWITQWIGFVKGTTHPPQDREKELEEAKKMFLHYGCNHFYMMKEGASKEYEKYHVGKKQEKIWHDEYIAHWLEKLSVDDLTALWSLKNSWTQDVIPTLIGMADKGDSYAKFWFADTILWISGNQMVANKQGKQAAIELFKSIVQGPVVISEQHRQEVDQSTMNALDASTPEEYLINYSRRKLTELKIKLSDL